MLFLNHGMGFIPYIFPPFSLLGKVLHKIQHDRVPKAPVIAPCWPTAIWCPTLLSLLFCSPIILPQKPDLLTLNATQLHPLRQNFPCRLACLRGQYSSSVLSSRTANLILSSWRAGTNKRYSSAWQKFCGWCCSKQISPVQSSIVQVAGSLLKNLIPWQVLSYY